MTLTRLSFLSSEHGLNGSLLSSLLYLDMGEIEFLVPKYDHPFRVLILVVGGDKSIWVFP